MELRELDHSTTTYEKDLGEDEQGRPMIVDLTFHTLTFESDIDLSEQVTDPRAGSWYSCHQNVIEGSELEKVLADRFGWTYKGERRLPGLNGIRSLSDDGKTLVWCWR
jgi:hypothetical protein